MCVCVHVGIHDVAACRACSSQGISVCKKNKGFCCQVVLTFTFALNASMQAMESSAIVPEVQGVVSAGLLLCHFDMHPIQLLLLFALGVFLAVSEMDGRSTTPWFQLHFQASQLHTMCPLAKLYVFCFALVLYLVSLLFLPVAIREMPPSHGKPMLNLLLHLEKHNTHTHTHRSYCNRVEPE